MLEILRFLVFLILFGNTGCDEPALVTCDVASETRIIYKDDDKDIFVVVPDNECGDVKTGNPIRPDQRCNYVQDCENGEDEQLCGYSIMPNRWDRKWTTNIIFNYVTRKCSDDAERTFMVTNGTRLNIGHCTSPIFQPTFSNCWARFDEFANNIATRYSMQLEQILPSGAVRADMLTSYALIPVPNYVSPFGYVDIDLSNINVPFTISITVDIPIGQTVTLHYFSIMHDQCGIVLSNETEMNNTSLYLCDDELRRINWEFMCDGKYDCNDGSDENVPGLCDTHKQCTFENNIQGTFFNVSISQVNETEFRPSESSMMVPQMDHTRRETLSRDGKMKVALLGTVAGYS